LIHLKTADISNYAARLFKAGADAAGNAAVAPAFSLQPRRFVGAIVLPEPLPVR
jgi:hypothetical protein